MLNQLASDSASAPISALVWLVIPALALVGGLAYAYWVTKLKSKYDNQINRSVGRFRKFQDSFKDTEKNSNTPNISNPISNPISKSDE